MSIATVHLVRCRIASAPPSSPIAVFKLPVGSEIPDRLEAVFANTVTTQQRIKSAPGLLVGCFDSSMDCFDVWAKLTEAAFRG